MKTMGSNRTLTRPRDLRLYVKDISEERLAEADKAAELFPFRIPHFYAENVLNGKADDPLLDLVLPSGIELQDGDELWDATPSTYRASNNPFWIQKYEYQGLIRLTTVCSGHCRHCYLKRNIGHRVITVRDVENLFDDLEVHGSGLKEVILSGGDPLLAPIEVLGAVACRTKQLQSKLHSDTPYLVIHTKYPVWDPVGLVKRRPLLKALANLQPKAYMINVIHPREVTKEFMVACNTLAEAAGSESRPALFCQHPVFRGINDSVEILDELYTKLLRCSPPVIPYYMVHPFYNGTLPKHRLSIVESQRLYQQIARRPGCMTPRLVVPTPLGKCQLGPYEKLVRRDGGFVLTTKDGKMVTLP